MGPLAGKAVVGSVVYLVSWALLHLLLRRRTVPAGIAIWLTVMTLGIGVVLTFPPVYQLLG